MKSIAQKIKLYSKLKSKGFFVTFFPAKTQESSPAGFLLPDFLFTFVFFSHSSRRLRRLSSFFLQTWRKFSICMAIIILEINLFPECA